MKIFYGVQGTGNGHISRAREMAKAFAEKGVDVTYLFSGRDEARYFDMDIFNGFKVLNGLTFHSENGDVSYLKTAFQTRPVTFIKEVSSLDLSDYDLVMSDFEPITAWAAKLKNKPILGIGHQYAFNHCVPRAGGDLIANQVMKYFAPTRRSIGMHWHHFGQPILPPVIALQELPTEYVCNKILVYLPFENIANVVKLLNPFKGHKFAVYSPEAFVSSPEHIDIKPLSRDGFRKDMNQCAGIICNAGFETVSEALLLGKKILVKPLHSQLEQISNAAALQQLGYGHVMRELDADIVVRWLRNSKRVQVTFPNVARILVNWVLSGMPPIHQDFIEESWSSVNVLRFCD